MIKLNVEEYCHDCQEFEPDIETTDWHITMNQNDNIRDTIIRCHYRNRCVNMIRYLERKMKNNEKE